MKHLAIRVSPLALLLLALLLLPLAGCVKNDEIHALRMQVESQRKQIQELKAQQTSNQAQITEVRPTQANLWAEMEAMRVQMAQMGGRMDEAEQVLFDLRETQAADSETLAKLSDDMDVNKLLWQEAAATLALDLEAMEQLSRQKAGITDPMAQQKAEAAMQTFAANATAAAGNGTMFGNATLPVPAMGNATVGNVTGGNATAIAATAANATLPAGAVAVPAPTNAQQAAQAIAPNQPKADPADILYQQALTRFKSRDYATAQRLWQEFSETFKKHKLLVNSLFWQGECFFQLKNYARAVLAYQEVISRYPNSSKYPAALLKQGVSFIRLGKKQAGELLLKDVIKKFPKSAEAKRAKELLKK